MSKSAILNYAIAAAETQNNSDRLAIFLEMNKPKRFSKRELGMALNLSVPEVAIALRDQPKVETSGDHPLKYSWIDNTAKKLSLGDRCHSAPQPKEQANFNPLCPECNSKSHKKGRNRFGKQRYVCTSCNVKFSEPASIEVSVPIDLPAQSEPVDELNDKFLNTCRHKTFYAVRKFRNGVISETVAKKIAKKAFPDISVLPNTRSLIQNARLLRNRVYHVSMSVGESLITEAIAHLISYLVFPDGED